MGSEADEVVCRVAVAEDAGQRPVKTTMGRVATIMKSGGGVTMMLDDALS